MRPKVWTLSIHCLILIMRLNFLDGRAQANMRRLELVKEMDAVLIVAGDHLWGTRFILPIYSGGFEGRVCHLFLVVQS